MLETGSWKALLSQADRPFGCAPAFAPRGNGASAYARWATADRPAGRQGAVVDRQECLSRCPSRGVDAL